MRLSKMHVLVEPINQPEAEEWVDLVMDTAYRGWYRPLDSLSGYVTLTRLMYRCKAVQKGLAASKPCRR